MIKEPKRILIIRTDRIGDVVLTTPAIKALRVKYPSAHIAMLVAPSTKDLVALNPFLDEVIVDDRTSSHKGFFGFLNLINLIQKQRFDTAFVFHTKKRTNLLAFCAGIPQRIGYKNNKFGFLLNKPVKDERHTGQKHESKYCMELVTHFGAEAVDIDPVVSVHEESEDWAKQLFALNGFSDEDKVIAIHLGASDPAKCWPLAKFAQLIEELKKAYQCKIILMGSHDVLDLTNNFNSRFANIFLNLAGKTSMSQLVSLLKHCSMLVSNDSGPVHIAAAVGTPVVSIFTRNQPGINPERWKPLGDMSRFVSVPPDNSISFKKAGPIEAENLQIVETQEVFALVDALFKLC